MSQSKVPSKSKKFWNFSPPKNAEPAELILYGEISDVSWWGDEVTPRQFSDELKALGDIRELTVRINSGGGDVFAAQAIYTRLKDHKAHITVKIDGVAASAATIIAMAGDKILIPENGTFMVHNVKLGLAGYYDANSLNSFIGELQTVERGIIAAYVGRTKKSAEDIAALMNATTWYTGAEAVENGFCDELMFAEVKTKAENNSRVFVNSVACDFSRYTNIPTRLLNTRDADGGGSLQNISNERKDDHMDIKNTQDLRAAFPDLVKQIEDTAAETARNAERERLKAIDGATLKGFENLAEEAKYVTPVDAGVYALKLAAKQRDQGADFLKNRAADVADSGIEGVAAHNTETGNTKADDWGDIINRALPAKN
ncbi:hypothetical protein FACS1894217_04810 [Clostridia bacterium]|nr:hypothetical protein FACS1894217_04810 [Clostridia bacterium]